LEPQPHRILHWTKVIDLMLAAEQRNGAGLVFGDALAELVRDISEAAKTGCSSRTIALWKRRFEADGLAGLAARHRGSKRTVLTPALQARILAWTRRAPPHGATHWSTRSLGRKLGVQHTIVARAWRDAGLQPHRLEPYTR